MQASNQVMLIVNNISRSIHQTVCRQLTMSHPWPILARWPPQCATYSLSCQALRPAHACTAFKNISSDCINQQLQFFSTCLLFLQSKPTYRAAVSIIKQPITDCCIVISSHCIRALVHFRPCISKTSSILNISSNNIFLYASPRLHHTFPA
jgi:hypothetical protein